MSHLLAMNLFQGMLCVLFILVCLLLIVVILLQRGRGGGLAGAFGGAGGHSAFGTRTGDVFTWVTVGLASAFLLLAVVANKAYEPFRASTAPATPAGEASGPPQPAGETESGLDVEPSRVAPSDAPADEQPAQGAAASGTDDPPSQ